MIEINEISLSLCERNLFDLLSFHFGEGISVIRGRSGSGKSLLLDLLLGYRKPDRGSVAYEKTFSISTLLTRRTDLLSNLSLEENIQALLGLEKLKSREYSHLCDLLSFKKSSMPLHELSGGEKKKAELIFVFLRDAEIYFLDEPFASLDVEATNRLLGFLIERAKSCSIIMADNSECGKNIPDARILDLEAKRRESLKDNALKESKISWEIGSPCRPSRKWIWISQWRSTPRFLWVGRIASFLLCVIALALALSVLPLDEGQNKLSGIVRSDRSTYFVDRMPPNYGDIDDTPFFSLVQRAPSEVSLSFTDDTGRYLFLSSPLLSEGVAGDQENGLRGEGGGVSIFKEGEQIVETLSYRILSTEEAERFRRDLPAVVLESIVALDRKVYYFSFDALDRVFLNGGFASLRALDGTSFGEVNDWAIPTSSSGRGYDNFIFSNQPDGLDFAPVVVEEREGISPVQVPWDLVPRNDGSSEPSFQIDKSTDGAVHITRDFLLNMLLWNRDGKGYRMIMEKAFALKQGYSLETPYPVGTSSFQLPIFIMLTSLFGFFFLTDVILWSISPSRERKNRKGRREVLRYEKGRRRLSYSFPLSAAGLVTGFSLSLLAYGLGIIGFNQYYFQSSFDRGVDLSLYKRDMFYDQFYRDPAFIEKTFGYWKVEDYAYADFTPMILVALAIVVLLSFLAFVPEVITHDRSEKSFQKL